jgi:hypothetical protein
MIAHLTSAFAALKEGREPEDVDIFAHDDLQLSVSIENLTLQEAVSKAASEGFMQGIMLAAALLEATSALGLIIEERYPEVDFQEMIRALGLYVAALPEIEEG